ACSMNYDLEAARLQKDWAEKPRWKGITRGYTAEDVVRLRGSIHIEHTLARRGADKLWKLLHDEPFVSTLGALTGNQALQQVKAGLKAIYLSGWQVAADANIAGEMYPDQSLYPVNSVPHVVGVPTIVLASTDAEAADLVTSDIDDVDKAFCTGERTVEGFYKTRNGLDQAVARALAYAPYADLLWCETGKPDLAFAKAFA